jgi:hypothetical protein
MIIGFLKFEENKQARHLKNPVRCGSCYYLIEEKSETCEYCGVLRSYSQPKTWLERLKRRLGIEISSDLIVLSIEEPETFFTDDEIDSILDAKKINVLDLEDVPDWNLMFFNTRRVGRPFARRTPLHRQITNNRPNPKLLTGNQTQNGLERKITSKLVKVKSL